MKLHHFGLDPGSAVARGSSKYENVAWTAGSPHHGLADSVANFDASDNPAAAVHLNCGSLSGSPVSEINQEVNLLTGFVPGFLGNL